MYPSFTQRRIVGVAMGVSFMYIGTSIMFVMTTLQDATKTSAFHHGFLRGASTWTDEMDFQRHKTTQRRHLDLLTSKSGTRNDEDDDDNDDDDDDSIITPSTSSKNKRNSRANLSLGSSMYNIVLSLLCICTAALAAGLTMGLMSLDPLLLAIKLRSGTPVEKKQAARILPLVRRHHLLLVTLLLLNSLANEALPLFLDRMVPGYVAVLLSVTFVLFFGEIIPSAVFTGPDQMSIASSLVPLVQAMMTVLAPVAYPISVLLDRMLHGNHQQYHASGDLHGDALAARDGGGHMTDYNRQELSALVRIQYEQQRATNVNSTSVASSSLPTRSHHVHRSSSSNRILCCRHHSLKNTHGNDANGSSSDALSFSSQSHGDDVPRSAGKPGTAQKKNEKPTLTSPPPSSTPRRNNAQHNAVNSSSPNQTPNPPLSSHHVASLRHCQSNTNTLGSNSHTNTTPSHPPRRRERINTHEVDMIEGALHLTTATVMDACIPLRNVYALPQSTILDIDTMAKIYASGYSRIPVVVLPQSKDDSQRGWLDCRNEKKASMSRRNPSMTGQHAHLCEEEEDEAMHLLQPPQSSSTPVHHPVEGETSAFYSPSNSLSLSHHGWNHKSAICGILMTRQLILVNPYDNRPLSTMPLLQPLCVSPNTTLLQMMHLFLSSNSNSTSNTNSSQSHERGQSQSQSQQQPMHLALVCQHPAIAALNLKLKRPINNDTAGVLGMLTLEDVLEQVLQEEIYDESDGRVRRLSVDKLRSALERWVMVAKGRRSRSEGGGGGGEIYGEDEVDENQTWKE